VLYPLVSVEQLLECITLVSAPLEYTSAAQLSLWTTLVSRALEGDCTIVLEGLGEQLLG
jgi:hypothetical protein